MGLLKSHAKAVNAGGCKASLLHTASASRRVYMHWVRACCFLPALLLSIVVSPTSADPITVTGGYIQIGTDATDFNISTTGPGFNGERETGALAPIMLSGLPGTTLNLSSTFVNDLTDASLLLPERQD